MFRKIHEHYTEVEIGETQYDKELFSNDTNLHLSRLDKRDI